jgi:transposase-like protein
MGAGELVRKYLESEAGSDLLAEMVKMAAELLMDADVDVLCGAGYKERSESRVNSRNAHRSRRWDTRAGTINLEIPKLRKGSYTPSLLEPRRRAEQALVSVVCQAYIEGVSTRRVDDLVRSMGIDGMSKSQVSELAKNLDARVAEFRNRPLDAGPYTYILLDALFHKVREGGRVVRTSPVSSRSGSEIPIADRGSPALWSWAWLSRRSAVVPGPRTYAPGRVPCSSPC